MAGLTKQQKADKDLIEANPKATPDELLQKGLSPEGYEKLMSEKGDEQPAKSQQTQPAPVKPVVTETQRAQPKLQDYKEPAAEGIVTVQFPDGRTQKWPLATAKRYKRGGRNANTQILD